MIKLSFYLIYFLRTAFYNAGNTNHHRFDDVHVFKAHILNITKYVQSSILAFSHFLFADKDWNKCK